MIICLNWKLNNKAIKGRERERERSLTEICVNSAFSSRRPVYGLWNWVLVGRRSLVADHFYRKNFTISLSLSLYNFLFSLSTFLNHLTKCCIWLLLLLVITERFIRRRKSESGLGGGVDRESSNLCYALQVYYCDVGVPCRRERERDETRCDVG